VREMTTTTTTKQEEEAENLDEFVAFMVWVYEHRRNINPNDLVWLLRSGVDDRFYLRRAKKHDNNDDIVDIIEAGLEAVVEEEEKKRHHDNVASRG
jgi:hypothetical protein